jgi:sirohydrochlorin cobaltochelatase
MRQLQQFAIVAFVLLCAPLTTGAAEPGASDGYGVLVMAHGGGPEWNQSVLAAVEPLGERHAVEVAFGMADACSIREAVQKLERRGARRIGVVRLFVSGESWYERTEQIFGLRDGAPAAPAGGATPPECREGGPGEHGHHRMAFFRLDSSASFALSREGLLEAAETETILAERARSLSQQPGEEDVLILAHGPADDDENERWLTQLAARAAGVRALGFHSIQVETLREDWPEKRTQAEERIREYVGRAKEEGRRVIVLPFRLSGFGPYAKVLEGQAYVADQQGLIPHTAVTQWVVRQSDELRASLLAASAATGA